MVYLLHFDRPYRHARHYIGFSTSERTFKGRLAHHRAGTGARLMAVITAAGVPWRVARTWPNGDRNFERNLKNHSGTRYCPICSGTAAMRHKAA